MKLRISFEDNLESVTRIREGDVEAFEKVFNSAYPLLVNFARGLLKDGDLAEQYVQDVFVRLWEKRLALKDEIALFPYLLTSVRNECLNAIAHRQVEGKYVSRTQREYQKQILDFGYDDVTESTLEQLRLAIDALPEKCRQVLELHRFEGLTHKQISMKLNISTKTVENHITRALKLLRQALTARVMILSVWIGELLS